jgi:hypothetical protein
MCNEEQQCPQRRNQMQMNKIEPNNTKTLPDLCQEVLLYNKDWPQCKFVVGSREKCARRS